MRKPSYGVGATDHQQGIDFARMRTERLARTQVALKQHGLAAALLFRPENIRYATGLHGPGFVPQLRYALVFAEHEPVMYELGDMLENQRSYCPWIQPDNWRFAHCWLDSIGGREAAWGTAQQFAAGIAEDLRARGLLGEVVGTDGGDEAARQALAAAEVRLDNVMPAMHEARRCKTADEVNCVRTAIAISNCGYMSVVDAFRPGQRERDVAAGAYAAMLRAGAEMAVCGVRSGPNAFEVYHVNYTDRIIDPSDLFFVNMCSTTYAGYKVCIYRSFISGRPPDEREQDWYRRCRDRVHAVIAEIHPGATTADAAARFLPASHWGYEDDQRLLVAEVGHGIGMTYEPPVISRIWSLSHPQPFEPGMVIAVEAREGEPGYGGVRLEEMVLVTDTGHEILTNWPADQVVTAGRIGI